MSGIAVCICEVRWTRTHAYQTRSGQPSQKIKSGQIRSDRRSRPRSAAHQVDVNGGCVCGEDGVRRAGGLQIGKDALLQGDVLRLGR